MGPLPQDKPVYQLLTACFLDDDTLHQEGEIIIYPGTPNEHMAPLNDMARQRMTAYQSHLDDCAREKAELAGRRFTGRAQGWQDEVSQVRADDKVILERRQMPQVPTSEPALTGVAGSTLGQRQAKAAASGVKGVATAEKPSGRPEAQPIHREQGLTQPAPLGGR